MPGLVGSEMCKRDTPNPKTARGGSASTRSARRPNPPRPSPSRSSPNRSRLNTPSSSASVSRWPSESSSPAC